MALALFLFIVIFERRLERSRADQAGSTRLVTGLQRETVTAIELAPAAGQPIRVRKAGLFWELEQPLRYPAISAAAERWLRLLEDANWVIRLTPEELQGEGLAEFGLAPARLTARIQQAAGPREPRFGNNLALGKQRYVQGG